MGMTRHGTTYMKNVNKLKWTEKQHMVEKYFENQQG